MTFRICGSSYGCKLAAVLLLLFCATPLRATAEITCNEYLSFPQLYRLGYVTGVVELNRFQSFVDKAESNQKNAGWLHDCTEGMNVDQVQAIFERFLSHNPEYRHKSAHLILTISLTVACKELGQIK